LRGSGDFISSEATFDIAASSKQAPHTVGMEPANSSEAAAVALAVSLAEPLKGYHF
jgi:hypothetical protein